MYVKFANFLKIDTLCKSCYNISVIILEVLSMKDTGKTHSTNDFDASHRITLTGFPYFTLSDVEEIYYVLNNRSAKGFKQFAEKAREIAIKLPSKKTDYFYQFMDEAALFELFQETLPTQLQSKGIDCWGRLMQYIS